MRTTRCTHASCTLSGARFVAGRIGVTSIPSYGYDMNVLGRVSFASSIALLACASQAGSESEPQPLCEVGADCGSDCFESSCYTWACGSLTFDEDCNCRPASWCHLSECDAPGLASEGEKCGTHDWCDRDCADGLTCLRSPDAEAWEYLRTCQQVELNPSPEMPEPMMPEPMMPEPMCEVGANCGLFDCSENDCHTWACGGLTYDENCVCRPPSWCQLAECAAPGLAGEGELCGTHDWCDRDCAEGLQCLPLPNRQPQDYRRTCQRGDSD